MMTASLILTLSPAKQFSLFDNNTYLKSELGGIEFNFEIPEKVIYEKAKAKFVINEKIWADFKAKGSYNLEGPENATYKNGVFYYIRFDSWGGGEPITYTILEHMATDNGLKIIYQVTSAESEPYKVQIGYKYNAKYANTKYQIINPSDDYYAGAISSTDKGFIDSIKIASFTKIS